MARVQTLDLAVERVTSGAEAEQVVGGGGFGLSIGPGGSIGIRIGHSHGHSHGGHVGHVHGGGYGGYGAPRAVWHDTSHYDYVPPRLERHCDHFHYVPGHYQLHRTGHYHTYRW